MGLTKMSRKRTVLGLFVMLAALAFGISAAAAAPKQDASAQEFAAQTKRRPNVIIRPRHVELGPNARRVCRSWLATEYHPSGTVLTPQMQCWWQ